MIFKSRLRTRIEKMISDIDNARADNVIRRKGITHKTEDYSKILMDDNRLAVEKRILEKALKTK